MRSNMGLKRVQVMLFDWQIEPFKKQCSKNNISFCEGVRRAVNWQILEPGTKAIDIHFETRKNVEN